MVMSSLLRKEAQRGREGTSLGATFPGRPDRGRWYVRGAALQPPAAGCKAPSFEASAQTR